MIKREKVSYKFIIFEVALFALLLALDLVSKYYVNSILPSVGDSKVIIPDILTFIYSENTGASFGMLSEYPWIIMVISSVTALAMAIFMIVKRDIDKSLRIILVLILSGAIGNIYDRIVFGYVRDFIHYTFLNTYFNISFAIGNVADIFLTAGAILLIIYIIFIYKEDGKKGKDKKVKSEKISPNSELSGIKVDKKTSNTTHIKVDSNVVFGDGKDNKTNKKVKSSLELSDQVEFYKDNDNKPVKGTKSDIEIAQDKSFVDFEPITDIEEKPSTKKGNSSKNKKK